MSNSISVTEFIEEVHDHQKGKVCSSCKEHKPLSEFYKAPTHKDRLDGKCKSCAKKYNDNRCRFKKWFHSKKAGAKQSGTEFTIEPEDIPGVKIEWYNTGKQGSKDTWKAIEYPKVCPVLGMELDWDMNGLNDNSPSLDRIDSTKGYVKGNVIMISNLANRMKSNSTLEQKRTEARYYLFGE